MTTSQIKRADTDIPPDSAEDVDEDATVLEAAQDEADRIIAKARYDAFRMVTDARSEAEAILSEAETDTDSPSALSESGDLAHRRDELIDEVTRLEELQARMAEKVTATRHLLTNLEGRLARIAGTAPASGDGDARQGGVGQHHTITVEVAPDDPDPLPPAASTESATPPSSAEAADQGSFYSRRSANLPSIGASGGQSALSAVSSIRSRIDT